MIKALKDIDEAVKYLKSRRANLNVYPSTPKVSRSLTESELDRAVFDANEARGINNG